MKNHAENLQAGNFHPSLFFSHFPIKSFLKAEKCCLKQRVAHNRHLFEFSQLSYIVFSEKRGNVATKWCCIETKCSCNSKMISTEFSYVAPMLNVENAMLKTSLARRKENNFSTYVESSRAQTEATFSWEWVVKWISWCLFLIFLVLS